MKISVTVVQIGGATLSASVFGGIAYYFGGLPWLGYVGVPIFFLVFYLLDGFYYYVGDEEPIPGNLKPNRKKVCQRNILLYSGVS